MCLLPKGAVQRMKWNCSLNFSYSPCNENGFVRHSLCSLLAEWDADLLTCHEKRLSFGEKANVHWIYSVRENLIGQRFVLWGEWEWSGRFIPILLLLHPPLVLIHKHFQLLLIPFAGQKRFFNQTSGSVHFFFFCPRINSVKCQCNQTSFSSSSSVPLKFQLCSDTFAVITIRGQEQSFQINGRGRGPVVSICSKFQSEKSPESIYRKTQAEEGRISWRNFHAEEWEGGGASCDQRTRVLVWTATERNP